MIYSISSQSFLDSTGADNIPAKDGYEYPSNDIASFYLSSRELVQERSRDHNKWLGEIILLGLFESNSHDNTILGFYASYSHDNTVMWQLI